MTVLMTKSTSFFSIGIETTGQRPFASGFIKIQNYIAISLVALLGMYNFWFVPKIDLIVSFLSFENRLMPRILGFLMFAMFLNLYRLYNGYINHEK